MTYQIKYLGVSVFVASLLSLASPEFAAATQAEQALSNMKSCVNAKDGRTIPGPGAGSACCSLSLKLCVICPTDIDKDCYTTTYKAGQLANIKIRPPASTIKVK